MEYISYRPIITSLATTTNGNKTVDYYGELNTNGLGEFTYCDPVSNPKCNILKFLK